MKNILTAIWALSFFFLVVLRMFEAISIFPVIIDVIIGIIIAIKLC